ncbi:insulin-like growth factor 1 receptor isoform X1 [Zerene cesonia]|uniref:insulin-like growth factor 1 receptor isoform X1 n=2 Tax=Zerene cesonia TaxID=33412 RepID=UPI0018E538A2|nr:insulin-like growth factor 1 receptor isoform X1 [Zerene cesonia]
MASSAVIWLTLCTLIGSCSSFNLPYEYHGYCTNMFINRLSLLHKLQNCTIILGDLKITLLERTNRSHFKNVSFPNLKEVTGFVVMYRVFGLESVGELFPNLMRIRGNTLITDYALIINDMPKLREIGLSNLLKIDRGGVIIWTGPLTCYVDSVNWGVIAPNARHVLSAMDPYNSCKTIPCTCSTNTSTNYCWNNRKCQRFLEGPEAEQCSPECIGCRKTDAKNCSLCRYFTYRGMCAPTCPDGTIVLTDSNYCVTIDECRHLDRWPWSNKCVSDCPENYVRFTKSGLVTCKPCDNCHKTCYNLTVQTLASIQAAAKCVYVKGSLTIHIRALPEAMNELRYYLRSIQEVSDFIEIRGSIVVTSLEFLPALRRIRGENLYNNKYSLVVHDMQNLQTLFPQNVTENLKVDRGTMSFYRNQMLCMNKIEKLIRVFPKTPSLLDIPQGLNGYSGSCDEVSLNLTINVKNETAAIAKFYPQAGANIHYTILYVKVPHGLHSIAVPEACSESDWNAVSIHTPVDHVVELELTSLAPATTYAICIEKYDPTHRHLARSSVEKFTTLVGKPKPPFIIELAASLSEVVVIRWVDHLDYLPYIVRYELDVMLIDIHNADINSRDHCSNNIYDWEEDYSVHARVMRPPKNYDKSCESMCGMLSMVTIGAMVDEYFDVCHILRDCDYDTERPKNATMGPYIKSLVLNLIGTRKSFQIGGLAPYRDYRFHLRACTKDECSQSARSVVKTLKSMNADIPTITFLSANEVGYVSVKWDPPSTINGIVLSYTVEVSPAIKFNDYSSLLPHAVCVPGNITSLVVESQIANKYIVRLCAKTLANSYSCDEKKKVVVQTLVSPSWWLTGVLFGIFINVFSFIIGWRWKVRSNVTDDVPLVDATSMYRNESEPPAIMMSDFAPIYSIPLRDTVLE